MSLYLQDNSTGIGIQNVKKRLEFIYPDKHELKMNDEGNFFVVSLIDVINGLQRNPVPLSSVNTENILI